MSGVGGGGVRLVKLKLVIFLDVDVVLELLVMFFCGLELKGWDLIGLMVERKKENIMVLKLWVGEMLKVGGKKLFSVGVKMVVFRDLVGFVL